MRNYVYRFIFTDKEKNEVEHITEANTPSIALHNIVEFYKLNLNDYDDVVFDELRVVPQQSFRDFDYRFKECGWGENQPNGREYLSSYNKNKIEEIYGAVELEVDGTTHKVKRETLKKLLGL